MKAHLLVLALLVAGTHTGCSQPGGTTASSAGPVAADPVASARAAVKNAALVIDVRSPDEFATGHLGQAENIPVDQVAARTDEIATKVGSDKSKPIALYCGSGKRAARAKSELEKAGFTNVTNAGGYRDLAD